VSVYVCACVCVGVHVVIDGRQQTCTGWLRLVGYLKLYVSFAEYRLFNWALLQKRPIIVRSLLPVYHVAQRHATLMRSHRALMLATP